MFQRNEAALNLGTAPQYTEPNLLTPTINSTLYTYCNKMLIQMDKTSADWKKIHTAAVPAADRI
jgi:hypothetical protein